MRILSIKFELKSEFRDSGTQRLKVIENLGCVEASTQWHMENGYECLFKDYKYIPLHANQIAP